jgi:hypothetical protein
VDGSPRSPYAVTLCQFEREVSVPTELRRESVGQPPVATPLSGDEASMARWNGGSGAGLGGADACGPDGDC